MPRVILVESAEVVATRSWLVCVFILVRSRGTSKNRVFFSDCVLGGQLPFFARGSLFHFITLTPRDAVSQLGNWGAERVGSPKACHA